MYGKGGLDDPLMDHKITRGSAGSVSDEDGEERQITPRDKLSTLHDKEKRKNTEHRANNITPPLPDLTQPRSNKTGKEGSVSPPPSLRFTQSTSPPMPRRERTPPQHQDSGFMEVQKLRTQLQKALQELNGYKIYKVPTFHFLLHI